MILRHHRLSPIDRQLEAFGEPWQLEPEEARDGEDMIVVGNNLFLMLREREEAWRDRVFRGASAFSSEDDSEHRERYSRWLEATERTVSTVGPSVGTIAGGGQLLSRVAEVKRSLEAWQSPRLSAAVGFRDMTLSAESAAELDRLLSEPRPTPSSSPRRMTVRDASFLSPPNPASIQDE